MEDWAEEEERDLTVIGSDRRGYTDIHTHRPRRLRSLAGWYKVGPLFGFMSEDLQG